MRMRRRHYERRPQARRRLSKPVISVGNLSVGGTGKTPVVAALTTWLIDRGRRPAILSRGYARADAVDGVVVVSDGVAIRASIDQSGDEPMMLARQAPAAIVCVSPDRFLSGRLAEQQLGADVHILDDGFQYLELVRDLDVLVTTIGEIPSGRVIPMGRLREPLDAAARAHVLVVSDATAGAAQAEAWALGVSQSCGAVRSLDMPVRVKPDPVGEPFEASVTNVLAVAGIANPDRFTRSLQDRGWNVVDTVTFPDHHAYSRRDIARIAARVTSSGANAVFTTDKDAVRFESFAAVPFPLYRVPLHVAFDPADALFGCVEAVIT
jgi:tetraacyldisaccharide 4'-kinase